MKAIVCSKYGPPSALKLLDVEKPTPKENEVLVRIRATAINDWDWSLVQGKPFAYRLLFGLTKPKTPIPGMELSGIVDQVGESVTRFKVGDEVYGDTSDFGWGSFAEFMAVNEKAISIKPSSMSFEDAAALPHASLLAYQGLVDLGKIQQNEKILINGAGGGMGTLGLQIAKTYNAEVTGVDTGEKLKMMGELGFDHIIDYKKENFTRNGIKYNRILDAKSTQNASDYARSLAEGGIYVSVGGYLNKIIRLALANKIFGRKNMHVLGLKPNHGLEEISSLYEQGKLKPIIDGPYKMEKIPELIQYFGEGNHSGKIIISIA